MNRSSRMNAEVKQIRTRITAAIGCGTCALGISLDIVGRRWGDGPFEDWRCSREDCAVSRSGLTADQGAAVDAISAELTGPVEAPPRVVFEPDSRLPPERDDEPEVSP